MQVLSKIGLGGGCHWFTEAVFQHLQGVHIVEQGYLASKPPYDSFSEGVIVHYDPHEVSLDILYEIHLNTHAASSDHSFRSSYRSAVYYFDVMAEEAFVKALQKLQQEFKAPIVTKALPFKAFRSSRESITDYYSKHSEGPFCSKYIQPKLAFLEKRYAKYYKASQKAI